MSVRLRCMVFTALAGIAVGTFVAAVCDRAYALEGASSAYFMFIGSLVLGPLELLGVGGGAFAGKVLMVCLLAPFWFAGSVVCGVLANLAVSRVHNSEVR